MVNENDLKNSPDMATVSIVKSSDYNYAQVYNAVKICVELLGGLNAIIKQGDKVFVKINHLPPPSPAEKGIITHPLFTEAVLRLLKEIDVDITVGDDLPPYEPDSFSISGYRQMCERVGVKLINLREGGFIEHKCHGQYLDSVYLSKIVLNADVVVNLPKFKTHSLTVLTGAVKNMYGVIPGSLRSKFHGEYSKSNEFGQVLTDIYSAIIPHLTVMDAIVAMEGEGPASGKLRKLGIVLASTDAVALDAVATSIVGFNPQQILTTRFCNDRNLGIGELNRIKIVGERLADTSIANFKAPLVFTNLLVSGIPKILSRFLMNQLTINPHVVVKNCTGCAECKNICPASAIKMSNNKALINKMACIGCMCCHEVCRFNAIVPRRSIIGTVLRLGSTIVTAFRAIFAH